MHSGCRFFVNEAIKNSKRLEANKKSKLSPVLDNDSTSDHDESEQGEIQPLDYWQDHSGSSSDYEPDGDSDAEDTLDSRIANESHELNGLDEELSLSSGTSSDSFHDDSSYESNVGDDPQAPLFENQSIDGSEKESEIGEEGDEPSNWHQEVLVREVSGRYTSEARGYPRPNPELKSGPTQIPFAASFPVDFFHLFFDIDLMKLLVLNSNAVGIKIMASKPKPPKGSNKPRWEPTSIAELYRFIAVLIHMGLKRQPTLRSYWSQEPRYSDSFVKNCFSRQRFEDLKAALHIVNPYSLSKEELKAVQKKDAFWRMAPLLSHLNAKFQSYFTCFQDIDVDEMCIGFKGRHVARCYNPNKPEKWHLKAFCLNDSKTGYLYKFYMYQGLHFFFFLMYHI